MPSSPIDRDKLRVFVRKLHGDDLLVLLDRAIDLLPASKLPKLVKDYARPADLRPDGADPVDLLRAVRRFHEASLRGKYYEAFMVNSKNFMDKSKGTQRWIAECRRLLGLCVEASRTDRHRETRTAFELVFALLVQIDDGADEIIFFADEAGSWQVGVSWNTVMPAWFRALAATSSADEYADAVHSMISYFASYQADKLLPAARRSADSEQKAALSQRPPPKQTHHHPRFELNS